MIKRQFTYYITSILSLGLLFLPIPSHAEFDDPGSDISTEAAMTSEAASLDNLMMSQSLEAEQAQELDQAFAETPDTAGLDQPETADISSIVNLRMTAVAAAAQEAAVLAGSSPAAEAQDSPADLDSNMPSSAGLDAAKTIMDDMSDHVFAGMPEDAKTEFENDVSAMGNDFQETGTNMAQMGGPMPEMNEMMTANHEMMNKMSEIMTENPSMMAHMDDMSSVNPEMMDQMSDMMANTKDMARMQEMMSANPEMMAEMGKMGFDPGSVDMAAMEAGSLDVETALQDMGLDASSISQEITQNIATEVTSDSKFNSLPENFEKDKYQQQY